MSEDTYLIWSPEHSGWWKPDECGYTNRLSKAGRYTKAQAIEISTKAIPGTAALLGMLPEIPVRLADIEEMQARHHAAFPGRDPETWE